MNFSVNFGRPASLKRLSIIGAAWTTIGYGISQVFRLASNLVLTRLLVPEDFGLMALVNVLMIGLTMFSDIGLGPSIIQNERGNERRFLDTAWTIQVIRGGVLWLCCLILAWPFATFYGEPLLVWLIPVAGLIAIISGFGSTGVFSAYRNLSLGRLTAIEIGTQVLAILFMLLAAFIHPSVWVLVAGSLFGAFLRMLSSHIWLAETLNKFCWEKQAVAALVTFGRWIFLSTIMGFIINSSASLILGKFITMTELGLFSIGVTLAKMVEQIYQKISNKVLLSTYSKIKHLPLKELRIRVKKIRLAIMAVFLPPLLFIAVFGQYIVELLFDPRYEGAGWILQIFAIGFIPIIITGIGQFYLAVGNSSILMKLTFVKFICYLSSMVIGWWVSGAVGIICGMAGYNVIVYFADVFVQRRYSIWIAHLDVMGIIISIAVLTLGFSVVGLPVISL